MGTLSVHPISAELLVHFVGTKVKFLALTMCWTCFGHENFAITLKDLGIQDHVAIWADALCVPYGLALTLFLRNIRCYLYKVCYFLHTFCIIGYLIEYKYILYKRTVNRSICA